MSKDHDAYGAGYRDGSINYELEHCPACKNVADLQEALDENAKLRELVAACHRESLRLCLTCPYAPTFECDGCVLHENETRMRELGVEVEG